MTLLANVFRWLSRQMFDVAVWLGSRRSTLGMTAVEYRQYIKSTHSYLPYWNGGVDRPKNRDLKPGDVGYEETVQGRIAAINGGLEERAKYRTRVQ